MNKSDQSNEQNPVQQADKGEGEKKMEQPTAEPKEQQAQVDLNPLMAKIEGLGSQINSLGQKIPDNLCEEFPHLCQLKDRVSKMEESQASIGAAIDAMGKKIPSKIVVHTGKKEEAKMGEKKKEMEDPEPAIQTTAGTEVNSEPNSNHRLDGIQRSIDQLQNLLNTALDAKKEDGVEIKTELSKTVSSPPSLEGGEEISKPGHPAGDHEIEMPYAHDLVNCKTCRGRLLSAFKERANGCPVDDPYMCELMETFGFLNKGKEGVETNASKENIESTDEGNVRGGNTGSMSSSNSNSEQRTETGSGADTTATGSKEKGRTGAPSETPEVKDTAEQPEGGDICSGLSRGECRALLRRRYSQK